MKASEVEIREVYLVKVSNRLTHVKILREHPRKGWVGKNLATNREIHVKSAQRLRRRCKPVEHAAPMKTDTQRQDASATKETRKMSSRDTALLLQLLGDANKADRMRQVSKLFVDALDDNGIVAAIIERVLVLDNSVSSIDVAEFLDNLCELIKEKCS